MKEAETERSWSSNDEESVTDLDGPNPIIPFENEIEDILRYC
jgi:hypothetical protein